MKEANDPALILIGMPGAGKSTLGVLLAKALAKPFIDTDLLIQQRLEMTLQDYVDSAGYLALRDVEEQVLMQADFGHGVVSTGGSAVYSRAAMDHLAGFGPRIYLQVSLPTLLKRVNNQGRRGLACAPGTTLEMLFDERRPLYESAADIVVDVNGGDFDKTLERLLEAVKPLLSA